ncbi:hypothetical protein XELAEV_18015013mg [Xenopus laevis]|uniref:CCHC-type domain-containing protein n=1 Tax=Xenopus laevis TaxID=8355 RepID=A0A974DJG8_XENLA|nr:hypothetical protein XELAEV_18015013mg [Xenopus laevis]
MQGNLEQNWSRFKQRFLLYQRAIKAHEEEDVQTIALFLTVAGQEAIDVYNTFQFAEAEKDNFNAVLKKFENYCVPRKNITYERHVFSSRLQKEHETIDKYVTDLRLKSHSCEFGALTESLIKDQLVMGIHNMKVKEKLLTKTDLTLDHAIQICKASEITQAQLKQIEHPRESCCVMEVSSKQPPLKGHYKGRVQKTSNFSGFKNKKAHAFTSSNCGQSHAYMQCPAYGKTCNSCGRANHFQKMCRSTANHCV